jgi:hypothetical protein
VTDKTTPSKHAFVSYVREDADAIDRLCSFLEAAGVPYWRDRKSLGIGDIWKSTIRDAIKADSLAFIACFSTNSVAKNKSFMNDELLVAVDEFRLRPPGKTYLIPVRLDDCEMPAHELGGGRTLRDVNYIDLFGDEYTENAIKLVEAIKKVMGLDTVDPAAVRTAVEEASTDERGPLLRGLTKEMVLDESRRIDLDDLVSGEVSRVLAAMRDAGRFPQQYKGTQEEAEVRLAETATDYAQLIMPFCYSLQVAARWAPVETLGPWVKGMKAFAAEANKPVGGTTVLLNLRDIPTLVSVFVAALAAAGQDRWDNFNALLVENTVSEPNRQGKLALIESVSPWDPFGYGEIVAHVLTRSIQTGHDYATAVADFNKKYGKFHAPVADWLFLLLRPIFEEQFPDDDAYQEAFEHAEAALGIVNEDLGNMRDNGDGRPVRFRNRWFGRSTWRYAHRYCDPVQDLADELQMRGTAWAPFRGGLFGASVERATAAIDQYREAFREIASRQW